MRRTMVLLLAAMMAALLLASGVAWAVNKVGTQSRDFLKGTDGADNLAGRGNNDRIFGLAGKDNLLGGPGKDVVVGGSERYTPSGGEKHLLGGPGNDVVFGGKGSDNISGNEGNDFVANGPNPSTDKLSAGDGNDVVGAFNDPAGKDTVACGGGFDRVFADKKDAVAPNCEKVADRASEFEQLGNSIPQSFWDGLPPPFGSQYPSKPQDYAKAPGLAKAFEKAHINPLVGDWRRKRTCEEYVSRLKKAGLADQIPSHQELLEEFGAGDGSQDAEGACKGVNGRLAHDHIFYSDGRFASVDNNGQFVDDGHYKLPNDHTIVFPNSPKESFPPVTAHFRFSDDLNTVTFDLVLPKNLDKCSENCRGDYAWAISVFFSGLRWHRVCQGDHKDNNVNGRTDELGEPCWIS
jgi:Ca2+-binding RTX toxin-like protein